MISKLSKLSFENIEEERCSYALKKGSETLTNLTNVSTEYTRQSLKSSSFSRYETRKQEASLNDARDLISPEVSQCQNELTFGPTCADNQTNGDQTTDWNLIHDIAVGRPILESFSLE